MSNKKKANSIVVFVTCPKIVEARKIAKGLVKNRLAACVNIIPSINSIYFWEGKLYDDKEVLCIIKTKKALFKKIEIFVKKNHSYKVPEIIALPIIKGSKEYLKWIEEVT